MKIAVLGYSCSGKTTLAKRLAELYPDHKLIHTDDFDTEYSKAPSLILDRIKAEENVILEGVHAYQVLRAAAESRSLFFDLVVRCGTSPAVRYERYKAERSPEQLYRQPAREKALDSIYNTYIGDCNSLNRTPKVVEYWA